MKSIYKTFLFTDSVLTSKPLYAQVKEMTRLNTFDIGCGQQFLHLVFYRQLCTFSQRIIHNS